MADVFARLISEVLGYPRFAVIDGRPRRRGH
jgi:hypothetical protein